MLSNKQWKLAGNFLPPLSPISFLRTLGETVLLLIYQLKRRTCFLIKLFNPMTLAVYLMIKKLFAFVELIVNQK